MFDVRMLHYGFVYLLRNNIPNIPTPGDEIQETVRGFDSKMFCFSEPIMANTLR